MDGTATGSTAVFNAEHFSIYVVSVNGEKVNLGDEDEIELNIDDTAVIECDINNKWHSHNWKIKGSGSQYIEILSRNGNRVEIRAIKETHEDVQVKLYCGNSDNNKIKITVVDSSSENKEVSLKFNANGGNNAPESIKGQANDIVTLPDAGNMTHEEGYTFMGWGKTAESGMANSSDKIHLSLAGETYTLTKDETLYAVWATSQYAEYYIRLDGQIPHEPGSYSSSAYTDSSDSMTGTVKYNTFYANTSGVNSHLDEIPGTTAIREACNAKVSEGIYFGDGSQYMGCEDDTEFESNYYVLWYVIKQNPIHVDGVLLKKDLYNVTYDQTL